MSIRLRLNDDTYDSLDEVIEAHRSGLIDICDNLFEFESAKSAGSVSIFYSAESCEDDDDVEDYTFEVTLPTDREINWEDASSHDFDCKYGRLRYDPTHGQSLDLSLESEESFDPPDYIDSKWPDRILLETWTEWEDIDILDLLPFSEGDLEEMYPKTEDEDEEGEA